MAMTRPAGSLAHSSGVDGQHVGMPCTVAQETPSLFEGVLGLVPQCMHARARVQVRKQFQKLDALEQDIPVEEWPHSPDRQKVVDTIVKLMERHPELAVELMQLGQDDFSWSEVGC